MSVNRVVVSVSNVSVSRRSQSIFLMSRCRLYTVTPTSWSYLGLKTLISRYRLGLGIIHLIYGRQPLFWQTLFRQSTVRTTQYIFSTLKLSICRNSRNWAEWGLGSGEGIPVRSEVPLLRNSYNIPSRLQHNCTAPYPWFSGFCSTYFQSILPAGRIQLQTPDVDVPTVDCWNSVCRNRVCRNSVVYPSFTTLVNQIVSLQFSHQYHSEICHHHVHRVIFLYGWLSPISSVGNLYIPRYHSLRLCLLLVNELCECFTDAFIQQLHVTWSGFLPLNVLVSDYLTVLLWAPSGCQHCYLVVGYQVQCAAHVLYFLDSCTVFAIWTFTYAFTISASCITIVVISFSVLQSVLFVKYPCKGKGLCTWFTQLVPCSTLQSQKADAHELSGTMVHYVAICHLC